MNSTLRCTAALVVMVALGVSTESFAQGASFKKHGPKNAIIDVDNIWVGNFGRTDPPYRTGSTVVWVKEGVIGGAYVPGGFVGSVNTNALENGRVAQPLQAVLLTGGSKGGLQGYIAIMEWLEEKGYGKNPLVAGAVVFDLGRGGDKWARPTSEFTRAAMEASSRDAVKQGNVGAGTGTHTGSGINLKGGLGTASVELSTGVTVGGLVITNAVGTPVNFANCSLFGAVYEVQNEFAQYGYKTPSAEECAKARPKAENPLPSQPPLQIKAQLEKDPDDPNSTQSATTIGVIATNAKLTREQANILAQAANQGHSRAINPINLENDGDSMFVFATATKDAPTAEQFLEILQAAREVWARAVVHATLNAESYTHPVTKEVRKSYCETFPSACKR
jgi:L-aminopeptidase/D-esterase-like protein